MADSLDTMTPNVATMSSREIANICGARHNDVVETIARLFEQGVLRESRKTTRPYRPEGGGRPTEVYDLTKRDTLVVVSGYNAEVRAKIIDRWMELERGETPNAIKVPTNMREALLLALQQQEKLDEQAKEITGLKVATATLAPKAIALDRISTSDGSYGLYEAAKILQVGPRAFVQWLAMNKWIYKRTGTRTWLARQEKINAGYLWHKVSTYTDANGEEKTKDDVKILPKGITRLARLVPGASLDPDLSPVVVVVPFAEPKEPATT